MSAPDRPIDQNRGVRMTGAPRSSGRVVAAPEAAQKAATMDVSSRAGTPPDNLAAGARAPAAVFSRVISARSGARVLGLDPGKTTGFCLYSPDATPQFGIYMMAGDDLGAHLAGWKHWLEDMLSDHRPAALALERPFGRAAFTSDLPGTLCGVAHMVAHLNHVPRSEFTASAVKKAMTGNGRASKSAVIAAVRERFGICALSSHEADAAAVAVMGWSKAAMEASP